MALYIDRNSGTRSCTVTSVGSQASTQSAPPAREPRGARRHPRPARSRIRALVHALIIFVGCILVTDAVVGERGLLERLRARRRHDELAAAIAARQQENARLREEARRLREDPAEIEAIARRDLGLIRRGELLFIVKDRPTPRADR